jgi:uncharacterized coiled-coil DUF342 family protein
MNRANKALVVMVLTSLGLWGCAQEQNRGSSSARIRALESKYAKLEDDFRAVVASRDQTRKKFLAAEEKCRGLNQQVEKLQALAGEREELRQQVNARTSERDALQAQFEQLRNGIRNLLGQADSVANSLPGQPLTSAAKSPAAQKS